MALRDKIVDLFYVVKDKLEDKFDEKFENFNFNKKKLIALLALILALIVLIVVICATHKKNGTDESGVVAEEVGTTTDSDAWWRDFIPKESDDVNTKSVSANEISWDPVPGAVGYNVYRSTKEDGEYVCIAVVTETSYTDTTAKKGKKYYYKTTAVKETKQEKDGTTAVVTTEVTIAAEDIVTEKVTVTTTAAATTTLPVTDDSDTTTKKSEDTTTKKADDTTKKDEDKTTTTTKKTTTSTTKKVTTTTTTKPTTTKRVIPSSGGSSTKSTKVNNALAKFNTYASTTGITTQELASYCGDASGISKSVSKTTNLKGISGTITGYDECYKFTSDYSIINQVKYFGYVFKVSSGTDPAEFARMLSANAVSKYSFTGIGTSQMSYKATAYYDQYVFFMISAQT